MNSRQLKLEKVLNALATGNDIDVALTEVRIPKQLFFQMMQQPTNVALAVKIARATAAAALPSIVAAIAKAGGTNASAAKLIIDFASETEGEEGPATESEIFQRATQLGIDIGFLRDLMASWQKCHTPEAAT